MSLIEQFMLGAVKANDKAIEVIKALRLKSTKSSEIKEYAILEKIIQTRLIDNATMLTYINPDFEKHN